MVEVMPDELFCHFYRESVAQMRHDSSGLFSQFNCLPASCAFIVEENKRQWRVEARSS